MTTRWIFPAALIAVLFFLAHNIGPVGFRSGHSSPKRVAAVVHKAAALKPHNDEYYDDQFYDEEEGGNAEKGMGDKSSRHARGGPSGAMKAEPVVVINRVTERPGVTLEAAPGPVVGAAAREVGEVEALNDKPSALTAGPEEVEAAAVSDAEEKEEVGGGGGGGGAAAAAAAGNKRARDSSSSSKLSVPQKPAPQSSSGSSSSSSREWAGTKPLAEKVLSRPARKPPSWLLEGHCSDPLQQDAPVYGPGSPSSSSPGGMGSQTPPEHTDTGGGSELPDVIRWSANSGSHEEHTGDVLLGECSCPLNSPPEDSWEFDCGDYDWRILSDLAPWHSVDITHEMLDAAFNLNTANVPPGYHFSISGGAVYMRLRADPMNVYHGQLLDMLRSVASMVPLPDCEFVMHAWDHAKVWRQDPIPVFSYIRDAGKTDVTIPYTYKWARGDFDLSMDGSCPEWPLRRGDRVAWRGGCTGPATGYHDPFWNTYLRYRATLLTRTHGDVLDAGLVEECVNRERAGPVLPSMDLQSAVCHQKYLLLLDGNTASGRSSHWLHSGAVLFKPDSVFSEWYYHLLRPWVHYVPVREYLEDLVPQAQWLLHEAPPSVPTCLARNLKAFAKKHIRKEAVACYWWRLLTAWAEKQKEKSRTEGFERI